MTWMAVAEPRSCQGSCHDQEKSAKLSPGRGHFDLNLLEATPGIEPGIAVLQTAALPLG